MAEVRLIALPDAEALREHLDVLNESGVRAEAAGFDQHGPFLVALQGPYAETEAVLRGVPWDSEVDWRTPRRCDECGTHAALNIDDLTYPVQVITDAASSATDPGAREVKP